MSTSGPPPRDVDRMVSLKVDNISYRTTSNELLRAFEKYGRVGDIYIPRDPRSRESRGFAFVRYNNRHDAEDAMDRMDGKVIDGREIRVTMARYPRPVGGRDDDRGGRGGRDRGRGGGYDDYYGNGRRHGRSRSRSRSRDRRRERSYSRSRSRSRSASPKGRSFDDDRSSRSGSRSRSRERPAFDDASDKGSRNGSRSRSR